MKCSGGGNINMMMTNLKGFKMFHHIGLSPIKNFIVISDWGKRGRGRYTGMYCYG